MSVANAISDYEQGKISWMDHKGWTVASERALIEHCALKYGVDPNVVEAALADKYPGADRSQLAYDESDFPLELSARA